MLCMPQLHARTQAAIHIWHGTKEHADVEMIPYRFPTSVMCTSAHFADCWAKDQGIEKLCGILSLSNNM